MKIKLSGWTLYCTAACIMTSTALAQRERDYSTTSTSSDTNQVSSSREGHRSSQFYRSKDLVGADVKDAQGQKLGDISEIYVNRQNGQTFAAIDIGNRRHAVVPLQALNVAPARGVFRNAEVTLNKSKSDLESGPAIADNDWQKLDDSNFTRSVYSHYNLQAPPAMGGAESPEGASSGAMTNKPSKRPTIPIQPQP